MKTTKIRALAVLFLAVLLTGVIPAGDAVPSAIGGGKADSAPEEEPPVGGDWRVRRGYSSGVINEAAGIRVLYCLFDDGQLAFFLDSAERMPVLTVDMAPWADPGNAVENIQFEDLNGDGYNDLKIPFTPGTFRVWRWEPANGHFESGVPEGWKQGDSDKAALEFVKKLQQLVRDGRRDDIAKLIDYPLLVNGKRAIKDAAAFARKYDSVITAQVRECVRNHDTRELMEQVKAAYMVGDGCIWFNEPDAQGAATIFAVNNRGVNAQ